MRRDREKHTTKKRTFFLEEALRFNLPVTEERKRFWPFFITGKRRLQGMWCAESTPKLLLSSSFEVVEALSFFREGRGAALKSPGAAIA